MAWSIGLIPVTEHGRAVATSALRVLEAVGHPIDVTEFDLGARRFLATGDVLPEDVLAELRTMDALVVGSPPVGANGIPRGILERGIIFRLRAELDLYVNLRRYIGDSDVDVAVVRENTEGGYIGEGGVLRPGTRDAVATQGSVTTAFGVDRCLRYAFELARRRRKKLTLVHKASVLEYSGGIWTSTLDSLSTCYDDVDCTYADVDTACVRLIEDASQFDVLVTDNLFGDIVTDVAGAVTGSLHRSGSADLNAGGRRPSLFEPLHASAARVAATPVERADPRGAYAAMALLLDHFGQESDASRLHLAVRSVPDDNARTIAETEAAVLALCRMQFSQASWESPS
ncbi:3-isopropylmalate dehydrogenase [Kribbella aluminosa]|uniref:3-isopropylmalate dehydrogenase n=1 Tax=Kribbella aluminosa TaxID=416017 RepID=A0ABS4UIH5_9ACTN|nr:isocitrate/isopropylmalate family dehydrogenase [Kribbella aluminosa]MBP2351456.1 3-isopropylmalate dehydrogenase [Kribbella aluminosa]